jgi:hypothetical protein
MSSPPDVPEKNIKGVDIHVLGDVNLDTLIVPRRHSRKEPGDERMEWEKEGNWWRHRRRGGAWLLSEIIDAALNEVRKIVSNEAVTVKSYNLQNARVDNDQIKSSLAPQYLSSSAILSLFPMVPIFSSGDMVDRVYRVNSVLGWVHDNWCEFADNVESPYKASLKNCLNVCLDAYAWADDRRTILVLHDTNSHFRRVDAKIIEAAIERYFQPNKSWIVWHMYSPLAKGNLWELFADGHKDWLDRTIAVVKMECLRQSGVNLPENISLEQESYNFVDSIEKTPDLNRLVSKRKDSDGSRGVRHLVVHQAREGVLHYDRNKGRLRTSCFYCPKIIVDHASRELGTMVGFTSILVGAIIRGITWSLLQGRKTAHGLVEGIKLGAVLDHLHYLHGYGDEKLLEDNKPPDPYNRLFRKLNIVEGGGEKRGEKRPWTDQWNDYRLGALSLPKQQTKLKEWNRIQDLIKWWAKKKTPQMKYNDAAEDIAQEIVRCGMERFLDEAGKSAESKGSEKKMPGMPPTEVPCPFEVHGEIKTAYRDEIDRFSNIRLIMRKYLNDEGWKSPLCIAVFGQPGSGKSFTIQQLLGSVKPDINKRPLEFNLTQFDGIKDLEVAFRKVQDEAVARDVPLVFFDEFDSETGKERLGWLKYFLSPMQDGKFKAGESTYRIGRAIFVFAGGISSSWHEFYEKQKDKAFFKNAKGTDFVSRLRGYLDIETINFHPVQSVAAADDRRKKRIWAILMFRRAVLLRSLLEKHLPGIFDPNTTEPRIDGGVVRAFLKVKRYEHESRSMQAIIQMSRISLRGRFQRSSLPGPEQLKMHVNAEEFFKCMNRGQVETRPTTQPTPATQPQIPVTDREEASVLEQLDQLQLSQVDPASGEASGNVEIAPNTTNQENLGS